MSLYSLENLALPSAIFAAVKHQLSGRRRGSSRSLGIGSQQSVKFFVYHRNRFSGKVSADALTFEDVKILQLWPESNVVASPASDMR